jgi:hypothetical protein
MPLASELESVFLARRRLMDKNSTILPKEMQTFYIYMYHIHIHAVHREQHGMKYWAHKDSSGPHLQATEVYGTPLQPITLPPVLTLDHRSATRRPIVEYGICESAAQGFPSVRICHLCISAQLQPSLQRLHNLETQIRSRE